MKNNAFLILLASVVVLFLGLALFNAQNKTQTLIPKQGRAWQIQEPYYAPNFDAYFPDDIDGGRKLDSLWESPNKDDRPDKEILKTARNGLRNTTKHKTLIVRWIGNKYIWGKSPQNPDAIELMYHATDYPERAGVIGGTQHYAVYFGLSVVRPKTPSILRALVDLSMKTDDPNTLSRVAWGAKSQQDELLQYLGPYLRSANTETREKAEIVEQIFTGKLNAFEWAKTK